MSAIAREELLDALRDLAATLGAPPTRAEMNEEGRYSARPYYTEFGSWNDALRAAGFDPHHKAYTGAELRDDLQRVADDLGHPPRLADYETHGAYHWVTLHRAFGSWPEALCAAGLDPDERPYAGRCDREELIDELRRVARELGRPPTAAEMDTHGAVTRRPYVREFGSWSAALEAAGITA